MPWIRLETGCQMPEINEFVLWRTEDGNYFVREIDRDDVAWWRGGNMIGPVCTHWKKITIPDEEPDQDILWDELVSKIFDGVDYTSWLEMIEQFKKTYTLIRK